MLKLARRIFKALLSFCHRGSYVPLTKERLADLFTNIERWDIKVHQVHLNPTDRDAIKDAVGPDIYDQQTRRALIRLGLIGNVWGANVITSRGIEPGHIVLVGCRTKDGTWQHLMDTFEPPPPTPELKPGLPCDLHSGPLEDLFIEG